MIKVLGPLEGAPDLGSIAPVLHHWAEVVSNHDKHVCLLPPGLIIAESTMVQEHAMQSPL